MIGYTVLIAVLYTGTALTASIPRSPYTQVNGLQDSADGKHGGLTRRSPELTVSAFAKCLKEKQPDWPHTQVTKEQTVACQDLSKLMMEKRQFSNLNFGDMLFSTTCTSGTHSGNFLRNDDVAAKVSHNVVQDDTATKFITDTVCPAAVDTFMGLVLKDRTLVGSAITSIVDGKGHHRSGPSSSGIVTDGKPLSVITTALITFDPNNPVGSLKGLALEPLKQKLREACAYTWVKGATSCTDDIKYGFTATATQKALDGMSGYFVDDGKIQFQFDIGTES